MEFCTSLKIEYTYGELYVYIYTRDSIRNPNSDTLGPDRGQRDILAVCVIAQHYSSATFASLRFPSRMAKFGTGKQK